MSTHQPINLPKTPLHSATSSTLADLEQESWQHLASALDHTENKAAGAGFKTMVVASRTATGADARMVVLRQVDVSRRSVWFHTDARSEKVIQFEAFPVTTLLLWDEGLQVQLRLTVETKLHTDDLLADEQWKSVWVGSRKMYLSEYQPGTEKNHPYPGFPQHLGEGLPSTEESEAGRKNFAAIECRVLAMDYLHLSRGGQTRACFQYEPESKMTWLTP